MTQATLINVTDAQPQAPLAIDYVSPSALETFALCPAKWGFRKIDHIEQEAGAGAALGSAVHAQQESYLAGEDYDLTTRAGEIAQCTQHLIPEQGSDVKAGFGGFVSVEVDMRVEHHGILFGGRIDATWKERRRIAAPLPTRGMRTLAIVLDHKTTRDFKYAKSTKEELLAHPQAPVYALWATKHYKTDYVELRWNYARTTGKPKALKSWHLVNRGEILQAMVEPVRVARRMLAVVKSVNERIARGEQVSAHSLEKNTDACGAFGGCPYQGVCNPHSYEQLGELQLAKPSFLTQMKERAAAQSPEVPGAGSAINPPESATPPPPATAEVPPEETPKRGRPAGAKNKSKPLVDPGETLLTYNTPGTQEASDEEVGKAFRVLLREVVATFRGAA